MKKITKRDPKSTLMKKKINKGDPDYDYEHSPVTKPNEIKGLLKIKQKRSKLDMRLYKA